MGFAKPIHNRLLPATTLLCFAAVVGPLARADDPPASAPAAAALAPPANILAKLESSEPEEQIAAYADWHRWRGDLSSDERIAANEFLADARWLGVLGNEALYDMRSPARRLSAYKLLRKIGGQRVYPYFVYAISDTVWFEDRGLFGMKTVTNLSLYVQEFFRKDADPTTISYFPEWGWEDVKQRIEKRFENRPAPEKTWRAIRPERFVRDLEHKDARRRRLAIRALAVRHYKNGNWSSDPLVTALSDADASVRATAVEAMCVIRCPQARGRLRAMAGDRALSIPLRRDCLRAIVRCGVAPEWTAEWLLENLDDWPPELDETVQECIVSLDPGKGLTHIQFVEFLQDLKSTIKEPRARKILLAILDTI